MKKKTKSLIKNIIEFTIIVTIIGGIMGGIAFGFWIIWIGGHNQARNIIYIRCLELNNRHLFRIEFEDGTVKEDVIACRWLVGEE